MKIKELPQDEDVDRVFRKIEKEMVDMIALIENQAKIAGIYELLPRDHAKDIWYVSKITELTMKLDAVADVIVELRGK